MTSSFKLDGIWAFWITYIFTRPLSASFRDLLLQPAEYGAMGLGTILTSAICMAAIIILVIYMTAIREGQAILKT